MGSRVGCNDGKVVPIIGEELLRVHGNGHIAGQPSLNAVVCHYLQSGGLPEEVYPKIRPILNQARFDPPEPLLQLAGIDRFGYFWC
jgi:hypothetical protein